MKQFVFLALLSPLVLHAMQEQAVSLRIEVTKDSTSMTKIVPLQRAGIYISDLGLRPIASFVIKNQNNSESYTYNVVAQDISDNMVNTQGIKTTPPDKKYIQYWVKKLTHKDNQLKNEESSAIQGIQLSPGSKHRKPLNTLIKSEETKPGLAALSAAALILTIVPSPQAKM